VFVPVVVGVDSASGMSTLIELAAYSVPLEGGLVFSCTSIGSVSESAPPLCALLHRKEREGLQDLY
jgi:hypothetical protein